MVVFLATGCGDHGGRPATTRAVPPSLVSTLERPKQVGFYALWDRPRGARRHTAIVLLGGSEGGLVHSDLAAALVAHGYPVLDLAYFREPGLPRVLERIPLAYFERALRWLAAQPQVDPRRMVAFGVSRGGELSLILAATFPGLVHGVVSYVPAWFVGGGVPDPRQPAWTYHGKPLFGWPTSGVIPVWRIKGPLFAVGAGDDTLWQSGLSVRTIVREMHQHGHRGVTALVYPNAGHLTGLVLPVAYSYANGGRPYGVDQTWYGTLSLGGSAKADLAARKNAWPKLLRFLAHV